VYEVLDFRDPGDERFTIANRIPITLSPAQQDADDDRRSFSRNSLPGNSLRIGHRAPRAPARLQPDPDRLSVVSDPGGGALNQ
jgi:hypothetical protein